MLRVTRRGFLLGSATLGLLPALPAQAGAKLVVFAAASLKNVLEAVHALPDFPFEAPEVNFAGSSALAKQIEQGATADVFISADLAWLDYLSERSLLVDESRRTLAGNELVLIAPAGAAVPFRLAPGADLVGALGDGRLALAQPDSVPAGKYAKAALETLGLWGAVESHLLPAENVRDVLRIVAAGEAPLGIVYASDARAEAAVQVVDRFDPAWHPAIVYPAAALINSANSDAIAYIDFLASAAAQAVFQEQGFLPPPA